MDLVVQHPPAGTGRHMSPTPGLGTHAHSTTDVPRPAPSTGGRERAAPPPRAETLHIPRYKGLAEWESRTAPDRGRNLTSMVERYPETARAAPPPRDADPSTIAMIVFESGHYYQMRISRTRRRATGAWKPSTPCSRRPQPCRTAPPPCPTTSPRTP